MSETSSGLHGGGSCVDLRHRRLRSGEEVVPGSVGILDRNPDDMTQGRQRSTIQVGNRILATRKTPHRDEHRRSSGR